MGQDRSGSDTAASEPLASFTGWMYDPTTAALARGVPTAAVHLFPALLVVEPLIKSRTLGRVFAVDYRWPAIIVQRLVWSYRLGFPGRTTILVDVNGELGSVAVHTPALPLVELLTRAGFQVVTEVLRGWEIPHQVRLADHPDLQGKLPPSILVRRSWWPEPPGQRGAAT